jgi:transcriptional regulator with XRE-family HTH domain
MPGRGVELPNLREERLRVALTQDELAEDSGVARSSIARIENGARAAVTSARRLARALGVEPADLMGIARPAARVAERRALYRTGRRRTEDGTGGAEKAPAAAA